MKTPLVNIAEKFSSGKLPYRSKGNFWRVLLIGMFFIFLWIPLIDMFSHFLPTIQSTEKRELALWPQFQRDTLSDFSKNFERFFNDRFGGRNLLVWLNNYFHVKWLKVSPVKSVIVGKKGWLFYHDKAIKDYRGLSSFSPEQLEKIKHNIIRQAGWLRDKNIIYLILICPNKHTIYSEYLPDGITRVNRMTLLDQLLDYLGGNEKAVMIDIRKELIEAKKNQLVYFMTDSHWNSFGSFIAYQKVMKELSKSYSYVKPIPLSYFTFSVKPNNGLGDEAEMLSLKGRFRDSTVNLILNHKRPLQERKIPKAVILHDSFIWDLKPFLDYHFEKMVMEHWGAHGFDYSLIEKEKPQVVLFEIVERRLDALLK
jgi:hypothetical protein